jgi:hypothetical protein
MEGGLIVELTTEEKTKLKWILNKKGVVMWTCFIRARREINDGFL